MGTCLDCFGYGTPSGGRGGTILTVGTADPAGDLQTHLTASGRRTIVWDQDLHDVAIGFNARIQIDNGDLTVSPMPRGVYVTNGGTLQDNIIHIKAENILVDGWRGRCGPSFDITEITDPGAAHSGKSSSFGFGAKAKNVRVTRSSFMFEIDKIALTSGAVGISDITFDHCIFGWGLFIASPPQDEVYTWLNGTPNPGDQGGEPDHSRCMSIQSTSTGGIFTENITLCYNWMGGFDRRVLANTIGAHYDGRYNLLGESGRYGCRHGSSLGTGMSASKVNAIGNRIKVFPAWTATGDPGIHGVLYAASAAATGEAEVYAFGNRIIGDDTLVTLSQTMVDKGYVVSTPRPFAPVPWKLFPGETLEEYVMANAGPPDADKWDQLFAAQWDAGTQDIIDDPGDLGAGYDLDTPTL